MKKFISSSIFSVVSLLIFGSFLFIDKEVFAQIANKCGATVCEANCVVSGSTCVPSGKACSFQNCNCSTSTQTFKYCSTAKSQKCVASVPIYCEEWVEYTQCKYCPTGICCSTHWVKNRWKCGNECTEYETVISCGEVYGAAGCGPEPKDGPTCNPEPVCTPTCPAGTSATDTGSGNSTNVNCSYRTGDVDGQSCVSNTVTKKCWDTLIPPIVTVTNLDNVSLYGCTAGSGYMGRDANNTNQIKVDYAGNNNADPFTALMVWFANDNVTPPTITKVYDTGSGDLLYNSSYGMLIRKTVNGWTDIYIPGVTNNTYSWVKSGTTGTGLRTEILGQNSTKLLGVKDVSVTTAGTTVSLNFSIEYYHDGSGLNAFERATEGNVNIFAKSSSQSSFLPSGGDTIVTNSQWTDSNKGWVLDLTPPVSDKLDPSIVDATHLNVDWKFSDSGSPILKVVGDASITNAKGTIYNIDDETSGVNNYVFGSGATGANMYTGSHLWTTNVAARVDRIDLNNNQNGSIGFNASAFDSSCNYANSSSSYPFGISWISSKGGFVNAGSSSGIEIIPLTGHSAFSNDTYWNSPFAFYKDEADITSELILSSASSLPSLLHSNLGTVRSVNHREANNRQGYWYSELLSRIDKKVLEDPTKFSVSNISTSTVSGQSSDVTGCSASKPCVVKVTGDLTVDTNFVCNIQTVFFVSGTTNLRPNITAPNQNDGCMFISQGNISVKAGDYQSQGSTYPKYDIIEAFMLSDGVIDVPVQDVSQTVKDGLLVHGSMMAFGSGTGQSITVSRDLTALFSGSYPVLALHFDNRYLGFAPMFFGGDLEGFRREVGFKPL